MQDLFSLKNEICQLTYHVESSHIAIEIHVVIADLHVVIRVDSVRSHEKTENLRVCIHLPYHIEYSHYDIMATSSLSTAQNETNLYKYTNHH